MEEESEEWEAVESREAVVVVSEEEGEDRSRVRTMVRRGERCKGRSCPL